MEVSKSWGYPQIMSWMTISILKPFETHVFFFQRATNGRTTPVELILLESPPCSRRRQGDVGTHVVFRIRLNVRKPGRNGSVAGAWPSCCSLFFFPVLMLTDVLDRCLKVFEFEVFKLQFLWYLFVLRFSSSFSLMFFNLTFHSDVCCK